MKIIFFIRNIFITLSLPFSLIIFLSSILSGMWLISEGEYGILLKSILFIFIYVLISLVLNILSTLILGIFMAKLADEKGSKHISLFKRILYAPFLYITIFLSDIFLIFWCLYILKEYSLTGNSNTLMPILIWSCSVAIMPYAFLVFIQKPLGILPLITAQWSMFQLFFFEISYILSILMIMINALFLNIVIIFVVILLISSLFQILTSSSVQKNILENFGITT